MEELREREREREKTSRADIDRPYRVRYIYIYICGTTEILCVCGTLQPRNDNTREAVLCIIRPFQYTAGIVFFFLGKKGSSTKTTREQHVDGRRWPPLFFEPPRIDLDERRPFNCLYRPLWAV